MFVSADEEKDASIVTPEDVSDLKPCLAVIYRMDGALYIIHDCSQPLDERRKANRIVFASSLAFD